MKNRLLPSVASVLPLFLVACETEETKALQDRREYFDRQIAIYEERVQKADQKLKGEIEDLERVAERSQPAVRSIESREEMLGQIRELIGGLSSLENAMFEKAGLIEAYKAVFQPKSIPAQTGLGDLTLTEGTSYKSVIVRETTATHLHVSHSNGFSQIPFGVLPDAVKSRIVVPPVDSAVTPDPTEVLARKPASIKSASEHAADRDRAIREQQDERDAAKAKSEAEYAERKKKMEEERKVWDDYNEAIASLDQQIRALETQISNAERERSNVEFESENGSVRIARADLLKKLRPFDDQIAALEEQLAGLQAKRAGVKRPSF